MSVRTSIDFGVPTSIGYRGTEFLFDYDDVNRLWKSNNGTNATKYQFDSRGNLIKTTLLEKGDDSTYATKENNHSGNTLIQEAGFPSHCNDVTAKTCNKPKWIKDARGHQRDYLYHSKSGQLLVETSPANDKGIRPQTRYHYQQYYAWYHRDDDGQFEAADNPIWLLAEESSCITGSGKASHTAPNIDHATGNLASQQRGCASDADEIKITYHYGQGSATQANNLWLRGKTTTTPDGSRTVCFEYDKLGNVIGETEPLGAVNGCQ